MFASFVLCRRGLVVVSSSCRRRLVVVSSSCRRRVVVVSSLIPCQAGKLSETFFCVFLLLRPKKLIPLSRLREVAPNRVF